MKITLITACYNSAEVLATAFDSVLAQTHADIDYRVVDGGSTDGTLEVIRAYEPRFKGRLRWTSARDKGLYDAINKGIGLAEGEVVGILNADDFFANPQVLSRVAAAFATNGTAPDAITGDICFVRPDAPERIVRYYSARHFRPWMLRWGFMPPHPSFYCRREHFERLGRYRTDFPIGADYELLIRFLWHARLRTCYLPGAMVVMRTGGKSTHSWKSTFTLNRDIVRSCRMNGIYTNLLMLLPKYLFKVFELACRHRGETVRLPATAQHLPEGES